MKTGKKYLIIILLLAGTAARAQKTEFFVSSQTGNPFRVLGAEDDGAAPMWNYSFGVEQYMIDKLSISLSYRTSFYVSGRDEAVMDKTLDDYPNGFSYTYSEEYDMYSVDIDTKYFLDGPDDDGVFLGSSLGFQSVEMTLTVLQPTPNYNNNGNGTQIMHQGTYVDDIKLYPMGFKVGHRGSTDVVVFDYYMGLIYFVGTGSATRKYEEYLPLYEFKDVAFIIGMKLGFKF